MYKFRVRKALIFFLISVLTLSGCQISKNPYTEETKALRTVEDESNKDSKSSSEKSKESTESETESETKGSLFPTKSGEGETEASSQIPEDHVHAYSDWEIKKRPTCVLSGIQIRVCVCGAEEGESIPALGHSYEWVVDKPATKTETGIKHEECVNCGHVQNENVAIPKQSCDHNFVHHEMKAPTCTALGRREYYNCTVCGKIYSDIYASTEWDTGDLVIRANGHTTVIDYGYAATCTSEGLSNGSHCSVCEAVLTAQTPIAALGHKFEWVVDNAATKTSTGSKHRECSHCHLQTDLNTEIPRLGCTHAMVNVKGTSPTCTAGGYKDYYRCSTCNRMYLDAYGQVEVLNTDELKLSALGHSETDIAKVDATCLESGHTAGKYCNRCKTYTVAVKTLPASGHSVVVDPAVPASCKNYGMTEGKHCAVCKAVIIEQEYTAKLQHTEAIDPATEATCTSPALSQGSHCSVCGEVLAVQHELSGAKGHTPVKLNGSSPTCTATGLTEGSKCSVCEEILVAQEEIPALSHNYVNKVCERCGEKQPSSGISYTAHTINLIIYKRTTYTVSGVGSCTDTDIVIPSTYGGYTVTGIDENAFSLLSLANLANANAISSITSFHISEGITTIGKNAFQGCTNLKSIYIPSTIISWEMDGNNPFLASTKLTDVYFGGSMADWNLKFNNNGVLGLGATTMKFSSNVTIHCTDGDLPGATWYNLFD